LYLFQLIVNKAATIHLHHSILEPSTCSVIISHL